MSGWTPKRGNRLIAEGSADGRHFTSNPDLLIKALDMAYEQRGRPQGQLFHPDQGSQYGSRQ